MEKLARRCQPGFPCPARPQVAYRLRVPGRAVGAAAGGGAAGKGQGQHQSVDVGAGDAQGGNGQRAALLQMAGGRPVHGRGRSAGQRQRLLSRRVAGQAAVALQRLGLAGDADGREDELALGAAGDRPIRRPALCADFHAGAQAQGGQVGAVELHKGGAGGVAAEHIDLAVGRLRGTRGEGRGRDEGRGGEVQLLVAQAVAVTAPVTAPLAAGVPEGGRGERQPLADEAQPQLPLVPLQLGSHCPAATRHFDVLLPAAMPPLRTAGAAPPSPWYSSPC